MHELPQHLIDDVGRNSERFRYAPPEARPVFRQQGRCRHLPARATSPAARLEDPLQRAIKLVFGIDSVKIALFIIMFPQRSRGVPQLVRNPPRLYLGLGVAEIAHPRVDRAQFLIGWPIAVLSAPAVLGAKPHGERLCKILDRMRLRIPSI